MGDVKRCSSCGAVIVFVRSAATGKVIPAQRVRTLYRKHPTLLGEDELVKVELQKREGDYWISHFETCPHASSHSSRSRSV